MRSVATGKGGGNRRSASAEAERARQRLLDDERAMLIGRLVEILAFQPADFLRDALDAYDCAQRGEPHPEKMPLKLHPAATEA